MPARPSRRPASRPRARRTGSPARRAGVAARCRAGPAGGEAAPAGLPRRAARRRRPPRRGRARSRRGRGTRSSATCRSHAASAMSRRDGAAGRRAARAARRRDSAIPGAPLHHESAAGTGASRPAPAGDAAEIRPGPGARVEPRALVVEGALGGLAEAGVAGHAEELGEGVADARGAVREAAEVVHRAPAGRRPGPPAGRASARAISSSPSARRRVDEPRLVDQRAQRRRGPPALPRSRS